MPTSDIQRANPPQAIISNVRNHERHLSFGISGIEFASNLRWHHFTSANRILAAATILKSGSVLLPYGAAFGFKALAMLVGDLRAFGHAGLRIIVREQGKTLRLAQATALMDLGVSLILPRKLSPAEVRQKVLSLVGTRYEGHFRRDVEVVIRQSRQVPTRQRMSSEEFRAFAHLVLESRSNSMPHTLVVLHPLTAHRSREIEDALSKGLRDGVYFINSDGIWLLLMACTPLNCQSALERFMGPEFENLLVGWRKIGKRGDILGAIDAMHEKSDESELLMA